MLLKLSSEKGCKFLKVLMGDKIRIRIRIRNCRIGITSMVGVICFRQVRSRLMSEVLLFPIDGAKLFHVKLSYNLY